MNNPGRKLYRSLVALAAMLAAVLYPMQTAMAAPDLDVKVQAGLDQKVKAGESAPLVFTIKNEGSAFSGDLVVDTGSDQSGGTGKSVPVKIGQGETATISMIADSIEDPADYGTSDKKTIHLYENGWRSGREILHTGAQRVSPAIFPENTLFIAGLAPDMEKLSALKGITLQGMDGTELLDLSKSDLALLPEEVNGWNAADIVAVDQFSLADLTQKQQEAMLAWVKAGGTLLVGGSPNAVEEAGIFSTYLPLDLSENQLLSPEVFHSGLKEPVNGMKAKAAKGATIMAEHEGIILAAAQLAGSGMVLQTSFPLGEESLRTSPEANEFWTELLNKRGLVLGKRTASLDYSSPVIDLTWTVGEPNELFPSFKVSMPLMVGIILFYILLIIPVLYWILRKRDQREYAWLIIPALAVLVSIAIFAYGSKGRLGSPQLQHSAVYAVQPDDTLAGYYTEALLTDRSGDYTFAFQEPSTVSVNSSGASLLGADSSIHHQAIVEQKNRERALTLRKLGFWSVSTIYGETKLDKIGNLETDLTFANKALTGTVKNNFDFPIEDTVLLAGVKQIELGPLGAGEILQVNEQVDAVILGPRSVSPLNYNEMTASSQEDLFRMRKEGLFNFSSAYMNDSLHPILAVTTQTQLMDLSLEGQKAKNSPLTLILQPIDIATELSGEIEVQGDDLEVELVSSTGLQADKIDEGATEYYFSEKDYTQTWQLPASLSEKDVKWKDLKLSGMKSDRYTVRIFNVEKDTNEPLEGKEFLADDRANDYVSEEGKITVLLTFRESRIDEPARVPVLRLTGEAVK